MSSRPKGRRIWTGELLERIRGEINTKLRTWRRSRGRDGAHSSRVRTLQDFTVLPTDQFRRCVIGSSSVIFLPTSSPTDYVRRLSLHRWFPLPSLYPSEKQKNHLPMVLQTEFARQKKKIPAWNIPTDFHSVGDIVIDQRKISVGKFVGECMKYQPNISVCKFVSTVGSYC